MKFIVFAASHREQSLNRKLALLAAKQLEQSSSAVTFLEYSELDMPLYKDDPTTPPPEEATRLHRHMKNVNGLVICTPEYNWSYPGTLKNIIDWTSRLPQQSLAGKTALLMCASPGGRGGVMGLQHLKLPLEALQMYVYPKMLPLGNAETVLSERGISNTKQQKTFETLIHDFVTFTRKLSG
ncbi:MAG: NAD(P)H-dependent oxidoreductase [Rickettsiales bacterium]|nr:NAD(P)H-dependent oxidoreductase [Rickettsiales bacterium]